MKIASWNINSIRIRNPLLGRFVDTHKPDILCLQETKVQNEHFPQEEARALGFPHIYFEGQKSYNGVAILSRLPLTDIRSHSILDWDHRRHISARLPDGTMLHNFYIPAGGDIPDRKTNQKFDEKLRFVDAMHDWFKTNASKKDRIIAVGDFNIAPHENDVWSHKQLLDVVSHTPIEVERLSRLQEGLSWTDSARHFARPEEKLYSWWSYRASDWLASNRGRRLDHIWVTPPLKNALIRSEIVKDARGWENPSDHVPVMVEMDLAA